jgi:acyl carrier protein
MSQNDLQLEQDIFEYIRKNTYGNGNKVTAQTLLFREGIFDSMGFVLLIDFLEEKYGVKANDDDLIEDNFESVSAIKNFILKKKSSIAA